MFRKEVGPPLTRIESTAVTGSVGNTLTAAYACHAPVQPALLGHPHRDVPARTTELRCSLTGAVAASIVHADGTKRRCVQRTHLGVLDSAVHRPDWLVLAMFSGEGRNIKGANAVRVHLGHSVIAGQGPIGP